MPWKLTNIQCLFVFLILMLWHGEMIWNQKETSRLFWWDRDSKIGVSWDSHTPAEWMPAHKPTKLSTWWRYQMEKFSALLAICAGNSPVTGEFPAQRPVTRSFDVFCHLRLTKLLSKQSWGWWFETPLRPLWPQCNGEYINNLNSIACP